MPEDLHQHEGKGGLSLVCLQHEGKQSQGHVRQATVTVLRESELFFIVCFLSLSLFVCSETHIYFLFCLFALSSPFISIKKVIFFLCLSSSAPTTYIHILGVAKHTRSHVSRDVDNHKDDPWRHVQGFRAHFSRFRARLEIESPGLRISSPTRLRSSSPPSRISSPGLMRSSRHNCFVSSQLNQHAGRATHASRQIR